MIWRDSLKIGVDEIDREHKELFERFNSFIEIVRDGRCLKEKIDEIEKIFNFLGEYVVIHFKNEEKLQKESNYPDYEKHIKIHQKFKEEVKEFNKKILENREDETLIQKFAGKVAAWLVNHVADEDQKIAEFIKKDRAKIKIENDDKNRENIVKEIIKSVFENLFQLESRIISESENKYLDGKFIEISITGELDGKILYIFNKKIALEMVKRLCGMEIEEMDDFVVSALSEITNIISGHTVSKLYEMGYQCDITIPKEIELTKEELKKIERNKITFTTSVGDFAILEEIAMSNKI